MQSNSRKQALKALRHCIPLLLSFELVLLLHGLQLVAELVKMSVWTVRNRQTLTNRAVDDDAVLVLRLALGYLNSALALLDG